MKVRRDDTDAFSSLNIPDASKERLSALRKRLESYIAMGQPDEFKEEEDALLDVDPDPAGRQGRAAKPGYVSTSTVLLVQVSCG